MTKKHPYSSTTFVLSSGIFRRHRKNDIILALADYWNFIDDKKTESNYQGQFEAKTAKFQKLKDAVENYSPDFNNE